MLDAAPPLPPPALEQPAPHQVSYGLVRGRVGPGTRWVVVAAGGRQLASALVRGRRFSFRVSLPVGETTLRVTAVRADGRKATRVVPEVFGLPAAARPRVVRARNDPALARRLRALVREFSGTAAVYVQDLTGGTGAAWNAKARFPAASTLKVAIAAAVLAEHRGIPLPGSRLGALLREMIVPSDDAAANALLVWLGGSTSSGALRVNALMRSLGLTDSLMYGGYLVRSPSSAIPVRVEEAPAFGVGKYTTAWDLTRLLRALWLASEDRGPLRTAQPGLTPAEARHVLWLLAHVRDTPKLDRHLRGRTGVAVLHKAGWISRARHDAGLVFWRGGVLVAGVLTWRPGGAGLSSDVLAGKVAALALERFRRHPR
ncbi:MAG TPA: serine hydrolase [Gaiellaceae bacterium]|nr:serine hydrolase [Gaiellaceae bacterium]